MSLVVKCNNCDWEGFEDSLSLVEFDINDESEVPTAVETQCNVDRISDEPTERDFLKGCPNCLTDSYLQDLN